MNIDIKDLREDLINGLYQHDLLNIEDNDNLILSDIIDKLDEIDDIIESNLFNYSLNRLSYIDRAIIRLATYELNYTKTHEAIIIDVAVELTKKFSDLDDERQHKFNNKLLDNIRKDIRG